MLKKLDEEWNGSFVLTLEEEAGGGFAVPAVGVFERGDEFGDGGAAEAGKFRLDVAVGDEAVDSAAIVAAVEVEVFLDCGRDRPGMLDHFAIHVGDVER